MKITNVESKDGFCSYLFTPTLAFSLYSLFMSIISTSTKLLWGLPLLLPWPQSMSKPSPPFHSHLLTSDPVHPGHSQWTSQPFGCVFFIWPCVSVMVTGYMRPLRSYSQTKTQSSCRTTGLRLWYNQVLFNIPARLYVVNPHDYITGKDHRRARTINHASFPPLSTCC